MAEVAVEDDALAEMYGRGAPFTTEVILRRVGDDGALTGDTETTRGMVLDTAVQGDAYPVTMRKLTLPTKDCPFWFGKGSEVGVGAASYVVTDYYPKKTGIALAFLGDKAA